MLFIKARILPFKCDKPIFVITYRYMIN